MYVPYMLRCYIIKDGKSPLVHAAEWGNEMAVLKLLDAGADVDLKQKVIINYYFDVLYYYAAD